MPDFLEEILERLNYANGYFNIIQGCLISIKNLIPNYKLQLNHNSKNLESSVLILFPYLERNIKYFLEKYNEKTSIHINIILKIFFSTIYLQLPKYLTNEENLERWILFVKNVLDFPIPHNLETQTQNQEEIYLREENIFWKNRKWCAKILQRFLEKYCILEFGMIELDKKCFAVVFEEKYLFLDTFIAILFNRKTFFVSRMMLNYSLIYMKFTLYLKNTLQKLHSILESIIFDVLIPMLYLNPNEELKWYTAPEEYIRKQENISSSNSKNLKSQVINLIKLICSKYDSNNQLYLRILFEYTVFSMTNQKDPRTNQPLNFIMKDALLLIIGHLKFKILEEKSCNDQIETFLEQCVFPEFKNQNGLLRSRTCWIIGKFGDLKFKNLQNKINAIEGIFKCLFENSLPIIYEAGIALSCFLNENETIEFLRPSLPKILKIYYKIINQISLNSILSALNRIILYFKQDIRPYCYELAIISANTFKNLIGNYEFMNNTKNDEFDELLVGDICLEIIENTILVNFPEDFYSDLEQVLIPIFNYCFSEYQLENIGSALSCLNILLFNSSVISDSLLFYYPFLIYQIIGMPKKLNIKALTQLSDEQQKLLLKVGKGWGFDNFEEMIGCLKNYIQKSKQEFLTTVDFFGELHINLLFKAVENIYEFSFYGIVDLALATTLIMTLIECHLGQIDSYISRIIKNALKNIENNDSELVKMINLEVISLTLWYNPWITLSYINENDMIEHLFQLWISIIPKFKYKIAKIRLLLGLASIFKIQQKDLPIFILNLVFQFIKIIIKLSNEIIDLRIKQKEILNDFDDFDEELVVEKYYIKIKSIFLNLFVIM